MNIGVYVPVNIIKRNRIKVSFRITRPVLLLIPDSWTSASITYKISETLPLTYKLVKPLLKKTRIREEE